MSDNKTAQSANATPASTIIPTQTTEYTNWAQSQYAQQWNQQYAMQYPGWNSGTTYPNYPYPYNYNNYAFPYNNTATASTTPIANTTPTNPFYYNTAQTPTATNAPKPMYTSVSKSKQPAKQPAKQNFDSHAVPPPPSMARNTYTPTSYTNTYQYQTPTPAPAPVTQNTGNTTNAMDANQWPPKLRTYVERSFAHCKTDSDRSHIEAQLKQKITHAINQNQLWEIDWDLQMIPQLPVNVNLMQKKRKTQSEFVQDPSKKEQREKRFQPAHPKVQYTTHYILPEEKEEIDWDALTIKGTSQELEKTYLRLTSAPDPSTVRPEPVLIKSLKMLLTKWKKTPDYLYTCEQFKSIRQDLTVQGIKNEFTVSVYETHARLALENNDLGEFNSCQTVLRDLYLEGIKGHQMEFLAYRLLYFIYQNSQADILFFCVTCNIFFLIRVNMGSLLAELTPEVKKVSAVKHALLVREAMSLHNYHKLFKLSFITPNKGSYLVAKCVDSMRNYALKIILKSYKPTLVPLEWLWNELAFESLGEFNNFAKKYSFSFLKDPETGELGVDTKNVNEV